MDSDLLFWGIVCVIWDLVFLSFLLIGIKFHCLPLIWISAVILFIFNFYIFGGILLDKLQNIK